MSAEGLHEPQSPALPALTKRVAEVVRRIISEVRPGLVEAALSGQRRERVNERHSDNFLSQFDLALHKRYGQLLAQTFPTFLYLSEEADPIVVGSDPHPDLCILVDPLDTSELAVRALNGYTQVLIYSRRLRRSVAAVVGDIFHHVQMYAAGLADDGTDQAFLMTTDGDVHRLALSAGSVPLSEALVTNFFMKPRERFVPLAKTDRLIDALSSAHDSAKATGRIGIDFGSVGLCHVAAGFTDAMIEFAKGFAVWDLMPGHYVLTAAGGVVVDLAGRAINLDNTFDTPDQVRTAMNQRQRFIAARTTALAEELIAVMAQHENHAG